MKKKMILIILIVLVASGLIIVGIYSFKNKEDKQVFPNNADLSFYKPRGEDGDAQKSGSVNNEISSTTQSLVENYIRDNISALSPEPAVLGGTFYVTSIQFISPNSSVVDYEDGHIALSAQVDFFVLENIVEIKNFTLINENTGCKDNCGNDTCEEIVCLAGGCPCAETQTSCPGDCK